MLKVSQRSEAAPRQTFQLNQEDGGRHRAVCEHRSGGPAAQRKPFTLSDREASQSELVSMLLTHRSGFQGALTV